MSPRRVTNPDKHAYPNRAIQTRKTTSHSDNRIVNKHATMSGSGWSPYASHLVLLRPRFLKLSPKHRQPRKELSGIALTIIIVPLTLSPSSVPAITFGRLHCYTVNLCVFYFYKLIGKLTAFLQFQGLKSSTCAFYQWPVLLPPRGVLLPA